MGSVDWLVVDSVYQGFVDATYRSHPQLGTQDYATQLETVLGGAFGAADFYSRHLGRAADVVLNAPQLQAAWLREHGLTALASRPPGIAWFCRALEEQVRDLQPEVLLLLDMDSLPDAFLRHLSRLVPLLVGQVAAPIDFDRDFSCYDLVLSSLPHFVERFAARGVRSALVPLAFEASLAQRPAVERDLPLVFVGSLDADHGQGTGLLGQVLQQLPLQVWAPQGHAARLPPGHGAAYRGEAWGLDMYEVLARSQVVVNRHIDVAEGYANNLRLYEATGMGACLLTNEAPNLHEILAPGTEVVTYSSAEDCVAQAKALLEDDERRERIAAAGQRRTLSEHSYSRRAETIRGLVEGLSPRPTSGTSERWRSPVLEGRAAAVAVVRRARRLLRGLRAPGVSSGHTAIEAVGADHQLARAWTDEQIPAAQRALVEVQLAALRRGEVTVEFATAAAALRATRLAEPTVLEVGCGSGYYATALRELGVALRYLGTDYSQPLLRQARQHEPELPFVAADGARLPYVDGAVQVLLSGCVLLHMPAWKPALAESFRVASDFVVLHRTPVTSGSTSYLTKKAYGVDVVELVFSEAELLAEVAASGGTVVREWLIDRYELDAIGSPIEMKTYLIACGATS